MPSQPAPAQLVAAELLATWEVYTSPPRPAAYAATRAQVLQGLTLLCQAVGPDAEGYLDVEDLRAVLHTYPSLRIGSGTASGAGRALRLAQAALQDAQPRLLGPEPSEPAGQALLIIESHPSVELEMDELVAITEHIQELAGATTEIMFGLQPQPTLTAELQLHVLLSYGTALTPLPVVVPPPALPAEEVFPAAARLIHEHQKVSASFLQRHLRTGYNRTGLLLEELEAAGLIWRREGGEYGVSLD